MKTHAELVPLLVVRGAARAIDFYVGALGAKVLARYEHGTERRISHADLALGGAHFAVTEEAPAWNSHAPTSLGGSPVVLQLSVVDAGAVLTSMSNAGATTIFPIEALFGERMARVRDPFGHVWILRQRLEELSVEEIQRRRDELFARFAAEGVPSAAERALTRVKDECTLKDRATSGQDQNGAALSTPFGEGRGPRSARIHLVIGPVGAGKSTFALRLARDHAAVRLTLDDWMSQLFSRDRPETGVVEWYVERAARCIDQIWTVAEGMVDVGTDVVLEIGLLKRSEREDFYRRVGDAEFDLTIHVLDASREVRRERVMERNRARGATFSMVVSPAIFELASDLWEPLDPLECNGRDVRFIRTDSA